MAGNGKDAIAEAARAAAACDGSVYDCDFLDWSSSVIRDTRIDNNSDDDECQCTREDLGPSPNGSVTKETLW